MNFKEELLKRTEQVNEMLKKMLPAEQGFSKELAAAINYSMLAPGKRLRPVFMWETYRLFGGSGQVIAPFMAAIEMIHTHSLIHDDLPAIDNDEYRRGQKTTHAVFGEAMGILSGDALLNYAYEVAFHSFDLEPDNRRIPFALQVLAAKTGIYGMLGGQSVDVTNEGREIEEELLRYIYEYKTSALIEASMMVGAILAKASDGQIRMAERVGKNIGLAFQIQDDILDVTKTTRELGKPSGSDEKNHKVTFVTLHGLEEAKKEVEKLSTEAVLLLELMGESGVKESLDFLKNLTLSLVDRDR